jgi:hypothetical protein
MKCLQCQKDFDAKRETAKYCSDKCKVKYHRKNGGKNTIKPFQMQVLYNSIVELIEKGQQQQFRAANPMPKELHALEQNLKNKDQFTTVTEVPQRQIKRTPAHWVELRRECVDADDYAQWLLDLENDIFLNSREKSQIKATT